MLGTLDLTLEIIGAAIFILQEASEILWMITYNVRDNVSSITYNKNSVENIKLPR